MKECPIVEVCKEETNYIIYYNYENHKLYSWYNSQVKEESDYRILLIMPFINMGVKMLGKWIMGNGVLERYIICVLMLIATTTIIHLFIKREIQKSKEYLRRAFQEIKEPTQEEWNYFLDLGKKQFPKQIRLYIWLALAVAVSVILFIWSNSIVFLITYFIFYLILYAFWVVRNPFRKYKLIKGRK
ncbi:MAG: hypothetical protein ACI4C5_00735 [Lachnospiraceae bacterium]